MREAINLANSTVGKQGILFSHLVTGPIILNSTLPDITDLEGVEIIGPASGMTINGDRQQIFTVSGDLYLENLTLFNGDASSGEGGAVNNNGIFRAVKVTFEGNRAHNGGALRNRGIMNIQDCTFDGNHAAAYGGAIYNQADPSETTTLNIVRSTFLNNDATTLGGAFFNGTQNASILNSTFWNNTAPNGAAITNGNGWVVYLENSTIAGNHATEIGGASLRNASGLISISSTIVAQPTEGANCSGTIINGGNNIDDGSTCGWTTGASGSFANTNPLLGILRNNGGPTQTVSIARTSPAVDGMTYDAAHCGDTFITDQRSYKRPVDGTLDGVSRCDIGAFEYHLEMFLPLVMR